MTPTIFGPLRRTLISLTAASVVLVSLATTPAVAAPPRPEAPVAQPTGIEDLAAYVPANSCSPTKRSGTSALGTLLTTTYPGTSYGGARGCGALPDSEHHDGRAVDWMNSIRNEKQAAQAKAVISWLLATDEDGNEYANARRLGVMYVIWNNKIWGSYRADEGWRPYNGCAGHPEKSWDTSCHRDHMHLSLSWAGATGRTSFWTGSVAAEDYGRCRPADLNWAWAYSAPNPDRCPRVSVVKAPVGASTLLKKLTNYSGQYLKKKSTGAAVTAVQQAVKTQKTGTYDAATVAAVKKWQSAHDVTASGTMNKTTWRAMLKALAPKK